MNQRTEEAAQQGCVGQTLRMGSEEEAVQSPVPA